MKSLAIARGMKGQREKGFTLVELITVVAIIALLVVYITVEIGTTNDDAKVGISNTFFLGNVPAALGSYKSRHANSCSAWGATGVTPATVRADLVARGLIESTPWQTPWSAAYDNANRRLIITFPTDRSDNPGAAASDIASSLITKPQVYAVRLVATTATQTTATNTAADRTGPTATIAANAAAQAVVVDYDCI